MKKITKNIGSNKFKKLILDMFRGYPDYRYFGMVESVIRTEEVRNDLIKRGILIKDNYRDNNGTVKLGYSLGANGLQLVSAWKSESSAEKTNYLTNVILGFTVIMTWLSFSNIFISSKIPLHLSISSGGGITLLLLIIFGVSQKFKR